MMPAIFAVGALFTFSMSFAAAFSIPKLLVLAIGLVPFAAYAAAGGEVDIERSLLKPALPLLAVMLASMAMSSDPWVGLVGRHNSFALGLLGVVIALAYHVAAACGEHRQDNVARKLRGLRLIAAAGAIMGVYAFAQWTRVVDNLGFFVTGGRAIGTIGSPTDLGIVLAMILPLAACLSPVYGIGVSLGLMATGSRGAWIAGVFGMLVYGLRRQGGRARSASILCLLMVGLGVAFVRSDRPWSESDKERIEIWKIASSAITERPILGHGPDSFEAQFKRLKSAKFVSTIHSDRQIQGDAHNDILQAAATLGLLGLIAYGWLLAETFRATVNPWFVLAGDGDLQAAVLGCLFALFVNAKVNPIPLEALTLAGVILGYGSTRQSDPKELPRSLRWLAPVMAAAVVVLVARLSAADLSAGKTDMASLNRAAELNPFEVEYKLRLLRVSISEFNASKDPALRGLIITTSRDQAAQAMRLRPGVSNSWYVAGVEATMEKQLGLPASPVPLLEHARSLDPYFGPIHEALALAKSL